MIVSANLAADVLAHYPPVLRGPITPLGNHGGFSGALLFRVGDANATCCLRAWPIDVKPERLDYIHALMHRAAAAGLDFVPRIFPATNGQHAVSSAGRLWELTTWMPGTSGAADVPHVEAAFTTLARLHLAWSEPLPAHGVCPAVERRWSAYRDWLPLTTSGWQPPSDPLDPMAAVAKRAWKAVRRRLPELPHLLLPWTSRLLPLQSCLCDIWSDHVRFTEGRVTGLIDFGSCKVDHVAVDLARLAGSMAASPERRAAALEAYSRVRPLTASERVLAQVVERTGDIVAASNWLRWLYREGRTYEDRQAIAVRLEGLVERLS